MLRHTSAALDDSGHNLALAYHLFGHPNLGRLTVTGLTNESGRRQVGMRGPVRAWTRPSLG